MPPMMRAGCLGPCIPYGAGGAAWARVSELLCACEGHATQVFCVLSYCQIRCEIFILAHFTVSSKKPFAATFEDLNTA